MQRKGCVMAVGGANLDISACADQPLRAADSAPGRVHTSAGGVARNVAENLARLGHATRLLSAVGDDPQGHSLLAATRMAGVDVSACWVVPGAASASYVSVHDHAGALTVAVNDMQIIEHITPERLAPHARQFQQAAALVVDCNLAEPALAWLLANCDAAPVFVDAVSAFKCRRVLASLSRVHTLKVNRLEAGALSGLPLGSEAEVEAAAGWLHRQGVRNIVLSLGDQGLYFSQAHGACGWQRALPVTVVSTTGAGDALLAGLVHSHLAGAKLSRAARFASGCAALTLTVASANHPGLSVDRVDRWLDSVAA